MATTFSTVTLEAEHVTEQHRTLENDHTITTVELPGVVNLYAVFDGGRVLLDQIKAPVVLEAVEKAKQSQQASDAEQAAQAQQAQPTQTQTPETQTTDQAPPQA